MSRYLYLICILCCWLLVACSHEKPANKKVVKSSQNSVQHVIIDSDYSFAQATEGSKAPDSILNTLDLIAVRYYSTDGKIHQGQLLTNKKISAKLNALFQKMLEQHFPIAKVIPIVKYHWNDNASMADNNSYSFCYRNVSYSKHAKGLAVDINPYFNPVRWKEPYTYRQDKPLGAVYNPDVPGTFAPTSSIVIAFREAGFRWGHTFTRNYDDHHFEYKY